MLCSIDGIENDSDSNWVMEKDSWAVTRWEITQTNLLKTEALNSIIPAIYYGMDAKAIITVFLVKLKK